MADAIGRYRASAAVRECIDLTAFDQLLARWPTAGWDRGEIIDLYRHELGLAVALASFLRLHIA